MSLRDKSVRIINLKLVVFSRGNYVALGCVGIYHLLYENSTKNNLKPDGQSSKLRCCL